jgi:hypothetical protein
VAGLCDQGERRGFASASEALQAVQSGLAFLAGTDAGSPMSAQAPAADPGPSADLPASEAPAGEASAAGAPDGFCVESLPVEELAECLRALERAESVHTAARARVLSAFGAQLGCEADGHGTSKSWLTWQTRITRGAAAGAMGWMRRLSAHHAVGRALATASISASWAKKICEWSDMLPEDVRADADEIFLAAAAGGASLAGLAELAEELYQRTAPPDDDDKDDGFTDRSLQLDLYWRGHGRLIGELTPGCAAALAAVLEALNKKMGPEDDRTRVQRDHDALEEACRRLIGTGLPDAAGQPTQIQLHMTLSQLRDLAVGPPPGGGDSPDGTPAGEDAWLAARGTASGIPGWLSDAAAEGYACDAAISPVVTGHIDRDVMDKLIDALGAPRPAGATGPDRKEIEDLLVRCAADVLSGPGGLASFLRTGLGDSRLARPSLPLDVGQADKIPTHLRRLVVVRHPRCGFPGCRRRAQQCQVHHIIPRSEGGPTALGNLIPLCGFHHLIAIHRWGWKLVLNPDGTTTVTSPDGKRTRHSHGPPTAAAA